ncbi:MAG: transposase, partial [Desulfovibrio sp.]|nr:transposase [Desulfovibrio sp.]
TRAVEDVLKLESRENNMPIGARWALVRAGETVRTKEHIAALEEFEKRGMESSKAYLIKEKLRWIRGADTKRAAARWRATVFIQKARGILAGTQDIEPMRKALDTLLTNVRLKDLNSLFQAARTRARGYRNTTTFITMIYLIAAPIKEFLLPL